MRTCSPDENIDERALDRRPAFFFATTRLLLCSFPSSSVRFRRIAGEGALAEIHPIAPASVLDLGT